MARREALLADEGEAAGAVALQAPRISIVRAARGAASSARRLFISATSIIARENGPGSGSIVLSRQAHDAFKERAAVRAAMGGFDQVFRVRHEAEHIARFVHDTGDVVNRAVGVG